MIVLFPGLLIVGLVAHPRWRETIQLGEAWRSGGTTGLNRMIVNVIDQYAAGGSVYFLSVGVGIAFPAVNYSRAQWASRFAGL